jgi:hypothetical protein
MHRHKKSPLMKALRSSEAATAVSRALFDELYRRCFKVGSTLPQPNDFLSRPVAHAPSAKGMAFLTFVELSERTEVALIKLEALVDIAEVRLQKHLSSFNEGISAVRLQKFFSSLGDLRGKIRVDDVIFLAGFDGRTPRRSRLVGHVMRQLGWKHESLRFGGSLEYAYVRGSVLEREVILEIETDADGQFAVQRREP